MLNNGGKLNPHLDYSMHPKLPLQRKINLIVYLNKNWKEGWGGELGLWSSENDGKSPKKLKQLFPVFTIEQYFLIQLCIVGMVYTMLLILQKMNLEKLSYLLFNDSTIRCR